MVEPAKQYPRWTADEAETLRRRWAEGASTKVIAAEIGRTPEAVRARRLKLKLPRHAVRMHDGDGSAIRIFLSFTIYERLRGEATAAGISIATAARRRIKASMANDDASA